MTLFLTSSPSGCPFEPGPDIPVLDTRNHFVANLRAVWPDHAVLGLAIAADPYAYEQNDEMVPATVPASTATTNAVSTRRMVAGSRCSSSSRTGLE